eukprot:101406-Chlamydomonas_euryale.AAC.13
MRSTTSSSGPGGCSGAGAGPPSGMSSVHLSAAGGSSSRPPGGSLAALAASAPRHNGCCAPPSAAPPPPDGPHSVGSIHMRMRPLRWPVTKHLPLGCSSAAVASVVTDAQHVPCRASHSRTLPSRDNDSSSPGRSAAPHRCTTSAAWPASCPTTRASATLRIWTTGSDPATASHASPCGWALSPSALSHAAHVSSPPAWYSVAVLTKCTTTAA